MTLNTLSPLEGLPWCGGVCVFMLGFFVCVGVFFLCKAQGDGAVNETKVLFQNTVTLQG